MVGCDGLDSLQTCRASAQCCVLLEIAWLLAQRSRRSLPRSGHRTHYAKSAPCLAEIRLLTVTTALYQNRSPKCLISMTVPSSWALGQTMDGGIAGLGRWLMVRPALTAAGLAAPRCSRVSPSESSQPLGGLHSCPWRR